MTQGETVTACMSPRELVEILAHWRLIDRADVVDGGLVAVDASRRHTNTDIIGRNGSGYFVKQAITAERQAGLDREATVYRLLWSRPTTDRFPAYATRLLAYDSRMHLLVLERVPDAANARERQLTRHHYPLWPARRLAEALALLHDPARLDGHDPALVDELSGDAPGALTLHHPHLSLVQQASSATLELLVLMQGSSDLCEELDRLAATWRPTVLTHRDIKWDNVLLSCVAGRRRLTIVDWELAALGDPAWDVGSVFADYLGVWLSSIPTGGSRGLISYIDDAAIPLRTLQPALDAFWRAYRRMRRIDGHAEEGLLCSAVRHAAARLLQTAFEQTQSQRQLDDRVVACVQLSHNLLRAPRAAARDLLNLA